MRMLMEKNNARLAALRSTDEEINGLIRCLDELKNNLESRDSRSSTGSIISSTVTLPPPP